ncbi:MAG TPA: DUF721 domain-containing protein [Verrucomicrobiaceae bacterium]
MRRATKLQRLRHRLLVDWRGAAGAPLFDNPVVTPQSIIPGLLREWKLDERVRLDDALATWRALVGDFIARHTAPDGLKRGVLTVRVSQPAVHHTLMQQKAQLLQTLQKRFGADTVRDLRFRHG